MSDAYSPLHLSPSDRLRLLTEELRYSGPQKWILTLLDYLADELVRLRTSSFYGGYRTDQRRVSFAQRRRRFGDVGFGGSAVRKIQSLGAVGASNLTKRFVNGVEHGNRGSGRQ